jgi:RHS repeat-associated protein
MLTRNAGAITQQWDGNNRLTQIVSGTQTTQFVYDGNDARVQVTKPDGSKTIYLGALAEIEIAAGLVTTRSYYYAGNIRVAVRTQVTSTNTLNYLLTDHLGSTSVVVNPSGAVVARQLYAPYGTVRYSSGVLPTQAGYTGQIADSSTGLMYYNARYYDPAIGRFISADSIVPGEDKASLKPLTVDFHEAQFVLGLNGENAFTLQNGFWFQLSRQEKQQAKHPFGPGDPQTLNRYAYVLNNPVKYTDPSGHERVTLELKSWNVFYAGMTAVIAQRNAYGVVPNFIGAIIGAGLGAFLGTGCGPVVCTVSVAVVGAAAGWALTDSITGYGHLTEMEAAIETINYGQSLRVAGALI